MKGTDSTGNEAIAFFGETEGNRYSQAVYVTKVAMASNILLTGFKFFAGIAGNSSAMVADTAHSLSDFMTDIAVVAGLKVASLDSTTYRTIRGDPYIHRRCSWLP